MFLCVSVCHANKQAVWGTVEKLKKKSPIAFSKGVYVGKYNVNSKRFGTFC